MILDARMHDWQDPRCQLLYFYLNLTPSLIAIKMSYPKNSGSSQNDSLFFSDGSDPSQNMPSNQGASLDHLRDLIESHTNALLKQTNASMHVEESSQNAPPLSMLDPAFIDRFLEMINTQTHQAPG